MRRVLRFGALLFAPAALLACFPEREIEAPTQIVVRVNSSSEALRDDLTQLRASVFRQESGSWKAGSSKTFDRAALDWPVDLPVLPGLDSHKAKPIEVVIDALAGEQLLAQTRAVVGFVPGARVLLPLWLETCPGSAGPVCGEEDCHGVGCKVCIGSACVPVDEIDGFDLSEDLTIDPARGSFDAGTRRQPERSMSRDARADVEMPTQTRDAADERPSGDRRPPDDEPETEPEEGETPDTDPDTDATVPTDPPACIATAESCDRVDNDCDGELDEGVSKRCWVDADGDGFAGAEAATSASCDECGDKQTSVEPLGTKIDCDDTDPKKSPGVTDLCGDGIDNDCDGKPDDESNNACGGPCTMQLPGSPGERCSNNLKGGCAREGVYECAPNGSLSCTAPQVTGVPETCDGRDNDCDGEVDEGIASEACSVGVGECRRQGRYECRSGTKVCSAVAPAPRQEICDGKDNDCDGIVDNGSAKNECGGPCGTVITNAVGTPCNNGRAGICAASGKYVCSGANTRCDAPYIPSVPEKCDGLDNDCDGTVDNAGPDVAPTWTIVCPSGNTTVVSCKEPALPSDDCYLTAVL